MNECGFPIAEVGLGSRENDRKAECEFGDMLDPVELVAAKAVAHRDASSSVLGNATIAEAGEGSDSLPGGRHPVTEARLSQLIQPVVGAKLNRVPDPASRYGGYLPRTHAIDILHVSNSIDADVRAVTAEGVSVFFYQGCDLIPWASIRSITIAGLDSDERRTGQTTYVPERAAEFDRLNAGLRRFNRDRDMRAAA